MLTCCDTSNIFIFLPTLSNTLSPPTPPPHTHTCTHTLSFSFYRNFALQYWNLHELCIAILKCEHVHSALEDMLPAPEWGTATQMVLWCQGCISRHNILLAWPMWDIYPCKPPKNVKDFLLGKELLSKVCEVFTLHLAVEILNFTLFILFTAGCRFRSRRNGGGSTGLVTETAMLLLIHLPSHSKYQCLHFVLHIQDFVSC